MQEFRVYLSLILFAFIVAVDVYSWQGIRTLLKNKSPKLKGSLKFVFWQVSILSALMMFYTVFNSEMSLGLRNFTTASFVTIYLSKVVFILFLLVDDVIRFLRFGFRFIKKKASLSPTLPEGNKISRQDFLLKTGLAASAVPFILLSKGAWNGGYRYRIHKTQVHLPNLPSAFKGLKILQISDIHSGSWSDQDALARGIQMAMSLKPDIIFFTGDLVNNRSEEVYPWMDLLSKLQAPMGVLSILGNHDYGDYIHWDSPAAKAVNLELLKKAHADLGWHLLLNEHITLEKSGQRIGIIGVENWGDRGRFQKLGDLEKATKNIPNVPVKLLLSHDPSHWDSKVRHETPDIDLTLAGHTHGFQFGVETDWLRWSPSQYLYEQWAGHYQKGQQQLYVNRGFGFLGFPGRVGILPEIGLLKLV
ncbi:MAG: metallophosphoesterase [Flavobacteriaceae bacterium]|nr:metallophosphoesterase [Flavobacteriaceae bacterium]